MVGVEAILRILAYLASVVGLLPLLPYLPVWVLGLLVGGFVLGWVGDRRGNYLLSNHLATGVSIAFFIWFVSQASIANLVHPLIELLCQLLAVRLATEKSPRHLLQLFLLATIILAASSMLTLDLGYLFYLVLNILLVTTGLVMLSFYVTDPHLRFTRPQWRLLLKTLLLLPAGSLVLMLVLFVVLPRTQTPLWNFLNPQPTGRIGMSDQVQPGSVAELAESGEIAFRVETEQLPIDALYWRGIVLNRLEGNIWRRELRNIEEKLVSKSSSQVELTIYSEPKADHYLVTLDRPIRIADVRHEIKSDGVIRGRLRRDGKVSYRVWAQYNSKSRQLGDTWHYLQVPNRFSDRMLQLAEEIAQQKNYAAKIDRLDRFFLQQQLSYSTTKLAKTENPVETFLFDSRRGYCEYFASSYAVLLRLAGVPARLVGGYLGGEFNQLGGYYLVGEDAAHVWVEAMDDDGFWQRIDPSRLAVNAEEALATNRSGNVSTLQAFADALKHNWSRMVLNYDLRQQISAVRSFVGQVRSVKKFDPASLGKLAWGLPLLLLPATWFFFRYRQQRLQRLISDYRHVIAQAAALDKLPDSLGLFALADLSGEPLCREFAQLYGAAVYNGRRVTEAEYQRLKEIIRQLKKLQLSIDVAKLCPLGNNEASRIL
ncbi:Transglutaminase-like enzyme, putative cysteine protease [Malonomonas rubra DSM 5091]|uniref:Transglutaminase-like enzyme, putative cysteine protease n=1 Tax=Malonomonas rubra DSM 5091 TaxID=1122189 RepID=A0A1M6BSY3_MALRU|nr:transglutaminaseTgpA domain-containing protein [Malonomonas rubra]SHI51882.1 Transglutaminase-like enzyme, putative cysteine protease [Malonomonas rubra DSM 5091]